MKRVLPAVAAEAVPALSTMAPQPEETIAPMQPPPPLPPRPSRSAGESFAARPCAWRPWRPPRPAGKGMTPGRAERDCRSPLRRLWCGGQRGRRQRLETRRSVRVCHRCRCQIRSASAAASAVRAEMAALTSAAAAAVPALLPPPLRLPLPPPRCGKTAATAGGCLRPRGLRGKKPMDSLLPLRPVDCLAVQRRQQQQQQFPCRIRDGEIPVMSPLTPLLLLPSRQCSCRLKDCPD